MKASRVLILATLAPLVMPRLLHASTWEIDAAHSSVEFSVRHMMVSTVKGRFGRVKGAVTLDDKEVTKSAVWVTVEIASVDTHEPKRDEHLKSADFFDVAKHPTATFKSTKIARTGKHKLMITGELNLRGVTKPIVLNVDSLSAPLKSPFGTTVRGAHATAKLDRKDFGIGWNKVLDNGGILVGNEVTLDINLELVEKTTAASPAPAKPGK